MFSATTFRLAAGTVLNRLLVAASSVVLSAVPLGNIASGQAYRITAKVYINSDGCRAAHALGDSECLHAYENAKAEFDEKAPRFATRGECEDHFQHCMIGDIFSGGHRVTFMSAMRGFRIDSGRLRRVVPVAYGGEADLLFQPRAVDRDDSFVSGARTADAQKTWRALVSAPSSPGITNEGFSNVDENAEDPALGVAKSYPLSPAMLKDLQNREREFGQPAKP
jgi:uncharacterized protein DUF1190